MPRRHRPVAVTLTIVCVPLGATIAGLLGIRVLPLIGWRALFVIGGVIPAIGAAVLLRVLPESPRYLARDPQRWRELSRSLERMGHAIPADATFVDSSEQAAHRGSIATLFQREWRSDTLALFGAFFWCLLAVYLGFSWLTALLTGAGFEPGTASAGITAFNLGGVVGALAGSIVIGRRGSRAPMLAMAAGAAAGGVTLAMMRIDASRSVAPILVMLTLTGGLINAVQTTMYALAAHVYPSAARATGVGAASAVGRGGAILSGYAGAWAIDYHGSAAFFALIAGAMCATFVSLASITRHVPRWQPPRSSPAALTERPR